jgi:NifU-like protein involved in Fe-S cluster formation
VSDSQEDGPADVGAPYGPAVLARLRDPRFAGRLPRGEPGVGTGEAGDGERGELVRIQLRVERDGRIARACFQAFGCPATIAAASLAAEWAHGRSLAEAQRLEPEWLAVPLELGAERRRSAVLAADALAAAARDLVTRPPTDKGRGAS